MNSQRFPGKSMFPIEGKPALGHILDSLLQGFNQDQIVVATSVPIENDPIREYTLKRNIHCYSGDETNVASRFKEILEKSQTHYFFRICGDSPLLDYRILQKLQKDFLAEPNLDFVTTAIGKDYPAGFNVELFQTEIFLKYYKSFSNPSYFEHVTKYFYENLSLFHYKNSHFESELGKLCHFAFDTQEDLIRINKLFSALKRPHYEYTAQEKCEQYLKLELSEGIK